MSRSTIQETWDIYRAMPEQDMYEYAPFLRSIAFGNILEVGVRDGVSTSAFLLGLDDKRDGHLWSIDWNEQCEDLFGHPRWTFIQGHSLEVKLPDEKFDVVLVDGDHSYPAALKDLERLWPLVPPGGMIMMHDVHPDPEWRPIVKDWYPVDQCERAWQEFLILHPGQQTFVMPGKTGLGVVVKNYE